MNHNDKEDLMSFLDERIRTIAKEVLESTLLTEPATRPHEKTAQISELQQCIMAKEFVSVKEVALLLNCSDGHMASLCSRACSCSSGQNSQNGNCARLVRNSQVLTPVID
jgi:hypothetical protein